MNRKEANILRTIWDERRETLRAARQAQDTQLSASCYVSFGTYGIAVCKHREGRWQQKTVNNWRALSFEDFMTQLNAAEWEKIH